MIGRALKGIAAGAAGSAVLNLVTYLDMLLRARPSSSVPADTATTLARRVGLELRADDEPATQSRRTAAGALLGYGAGLGIGAGYAIVEKDGPGLPVPLAAILLGGAAMAASDLPAAATGATDPRAWGLSSWLADIVPHLAYGLATVVVYRALRDA